MPAPTPHPLAAFSRYLAGRHQVLETLAAEILAHLDACDEHGLPAASRRRASDLMWLWTLGAYEVARTMSQAHTCFAPRLLRELSRLKSELEQVRVANTKMERVNYDRRASPTAIPSDRDPDEWHAQARDLLVGDPARPTAARTLLTAYTRTLATLTPDEILARHEDSFK